MAPSTAWAESPVTAGGSAATRSADSSPPATRSVRGGPTPVPSGAQAPDAGRPAEAASMRGNPRRRGISPFPDRPDHGSLPARPRQCCRLSPARRPSRPSRCRPRTPTLPHRLRHRRQPLRHRRQPLRHRRQPLRHGEYGIIPDQHNFNNATPTFGGQLPTVSGARPEQRADRAGRLRCRWRIR